MNTTSKVSLGIFAGLCALWDAYTTFGGMYQVTGSQWLAIILTFFINGAIIISFVETDNGFVQFILVLIVLTAIVCDAYTAYNGNFALFENGTLGEGAKVGISVGMTIVSVGCSLLVSFLIFRD
jgi:hypothetical protein